MTCPFREWDVAYVLGSLSRGDRQVYERHLAVCQPCEHEVGRLAGTAGLLSHVPAEWAVESLTTAPAVPATVLPRLVRTVRRRTSVLMATAVLVAAGTGVVVAFLLFS